MNQPVLFQLPGAPGQAVPGAGLPPGVPGGLVMPRGTADNPLDIGGAPHPPVVTLPLSHLRQSSMMNLELSRDVVSPVTVVAEVDATNLMSVREQAKQPFQQATGMPLTYLPFFAWATVQALKAYPVMNSVLMPHGFIIPRQINLGVATSVPGAVLIPTLRSAERRNLWEMARDLHLQTERAKAGVLPPSEMSGQTFVISNTGRYGKTLFGTPVIKPPNVGILAFESIQKRPVVAENDQIVARPMMYLALTADHRAVDGAEMIGFLGKITEILKGGRFG